MQIAFFIFPELTALDAIGPYEVLQRLPGAEVVFVGAKRGEVRTDNGKLGLTVDATLEEVTAPEVLVVPGGYGTRPLVHDEPTLDWIRQVHETTRFTTSVCTGSLLLAAAGLLDGLDATTHWGAKAQLEELGAALHRAAGRAEREDHHRGGRVVGHRHGAFARGAALRSRDGTSHAALHRVRPPAAVRHRRGVEGDR